MWEIVSRPEEKFVVPSKWIFKIKHAAVGSIENYKARFIARGFFRKEGIDYEETFAPVARLEQYESYWPLHVFITSNYIKWMLKVLF